MSVNDRSAVSRQFVASSPSVASSMNDLVTGRRKWIYYIAYTVVAVSVFVLTMVRPLRPWMSWGLGTVVALCVVGPLVWLAYLWWRSRRKVLIDVTSDGLTVSGSPVFPFAGAQFGPWVTMGVALHLQSGSRTFVLGGRDRRVAPSTRLDAPPVAAVDAWLWDAEFDELLTIGGLSSVRGPASEGPTRCLLFPNPYLAEEMGSFAFRKHVRFERTLSQPSLFLDVNSDAIRVVDPTSGAVSASAPRAQVTAAPAVFQPDSVNSGDGSTYNYPAVTGLVLQLPGEQPMTVGCLDLMGAEFRFSWRDGVPRVNERPACVTSGGDWLTLIETFGLTAQAVGRQKP
jgi:hypothetical protein